MRRRFTIELKVLQYSRAQVKPHASMTRHRDIHTPRPFTSSSMSERPSTCSAGHEAGRDSCPWKMLLSHFPAVPSHQQFRDRFPASAVDAKSENASSVTACAPHDYFPTALYFKRRASVSSRHTQRTQSTMEAVPTYILNTVTRRQNTYRKPSITSSTESSTRSITPLQFFKQTLGQGNGVVPGTDTYQWYASQASESSSGFRFATTPSVGNSIDSDNDTPITHPIKYDTPALLRPRLTPTPALTKNKNHIHLVMGSVKFLEDLASKLKGIVHTGHKAENVSRKAPVKGRNRNGTGGGAGTAALSLNKRRRSRKATSADRDIYGTRNFAWGYGEKILRIKNNDTGSCVFMVYVFFFLQTPGLFCSHISISQDFRAYQPPENFRNTNPVCILAFPHFHKLGISLSRPRGLE